MADSSVRDWLASDPGPFQADTEGDVWCAAYENFSGLAVGGYDLRFAFEVEEAGYTVQAVPSGGFHLAKVAAMISEGTTRRERKEG